jgi:D-alanine-D-alanine ligase-like ATP-grasp enzyme
MHDLRLVFVNDKLIYSYIREPQDGSYLANLAQGGSLKIVPKNKLPKSLEPIISHAKELFETFNPRIYSIDFMFDEKKQPWVVELNSMPGLFFTPEEKPYMTEMYKELLKVFKKKLKLK